MKISLTFSELSALSVAIQTWIGDLHEYKVLYEHQLYRQHILCELARKARLKLAEKEGIQGNFSMKFQSIEAFTLLRCYDEEEDELLIHIIRPIMVKFDRQRACNNQYIHAFS